MYFLNALFLVVLNPVNSVIIKCLLFDSASKAESVVKLGWVVLRILCHFNNLSVISQLGSKRYTMSGIEVARPRFEPWTYCSAS